MERQPRHRMHQHRLAERRPRPRPALEIDRRFHVHEGQRHEFGEAAGLGSADRGRAAGAAPNAGSSSIWPNMMVAVRPEADAVRGPHDVEPLLRCVILSGQSIARTSSSRISAAVPGSVPRPAAFSSRRNSVTGMPSVCAPCQISSGENACTCISGTAAFTARQMSRYVCAGVGGMDAALHADFGRAALPRPRVTRSADLLQSQIVGLAAQILARLALGEGAELAVEGADVGVVDVAVDDIGDGVAVDVAAQFVGGRADRRKVVAARAEQARRSRLRRASRRAAPSPARGRDPRDRSIDGAAARSIRSRAPAMARRGPGDQSSARGSPSPSMPCSTRVRKPGSSQRLAFARDRPDRSRDARQDACRPRWWPPPVLADAATALRD